MTQRAAAARSLPQAPSGDGGSAAVEYGLIVVALAGAIAAVVYGFGGFVDETFGGAKNCLQNHATRHPECQTPAQDLEPPPP